MGESPFNVGRTPIADNTVKLPIFQPLAEWRTHVASIETNGFCFEVEPFPLAIKPFKIRNTVMDVSSGDMGVGDQVVLAASGTMVEIKEAFGFAFAHHVTTVRVRSALLDLSGFDNKLFLLERFLAMGLTIRRNR